MNRDTGPIVSSAHLVSEKSAELSEFEFGLMIASEAFNRWVVRCMGAAGVRDLSTLDVVVLHSVNHRGREKRLNDTCFVLNIEDAHLVTYTLKKLGRLGLVERSLRKQGIPAKISSTASTYACNQIMYTSLHLIAEKKLPTRGGFIHVPCSPRHVAGLTYPFQEFPSMSVGLMTDAVRTAIAVTLARETDIEAPPPGY